MPKRNGFTLFELLVVISIIAVLSAIGMTVFGNVQASARDAKRKQDLQAIATALELYYQKNSRYPWTQTSDGLTAWENSSQAQPWLRDYFVTPIPLTPNFIQDLPVDPKNTGGTQPWRPDNYVYGYWAGDASSLAPTCPGRGQFFVLVAQLENRSDQDRQEIRQKKWCDGTVLDPSVWSNYSFIITSQY